MSIKNRHLPFHFDWIDALKAFALLGILLNHFVEVFSTGPWFTNPSSDWPDFSSRMQSLYPGDENIGVTIFRYLGWLGDSAPGIFILLSGLALTLSALNNGEEKFSTLDFYKKRLLRIFPLYLVIHFLILTVYIFIPESNVIIPEPNTFLSLLGVRASDTLFFSFNPSWWFIWLVIQLYMVFPFLFKLLNKIRIRQFLIITLTLTFLSRGLGILGIKYNHELYYWMTGSFFGTRLAEFTTGMVIGLILFNNKTLFLKQKSPVAIFIASISIYITGLLCSFTLIGSVVSNLLVTVGLSGIFYITWKGLKNLNFKGITTIISWIGINSFAVFLLHQPFLIWSSNHFSGPRRYLLTFIILIICFPAAYLIEKATQYLIRQIENITNHQLIKWFLHLNCAVIIFIWFFIEPKIQEDFFYNIFSILITIDLIFILIFSIKVKTGRDFIHKPFWYGTFIVSILQLYFFPANFGFITTFFLLIVFLIGVISFRSLKPNNGRIIAFLGSTLIAYIILFGGVEKYLKENYPLETTDRWGEFPALQLDSNKVYSLKPNKITHLKYNNYDYWLKTNSLGMNYPEFSIERPDSIDLRILVIGDAFTMPEGLEYSSSYTYFLEQTLNSQNITSKKIEVINAGVTGYGPIEELGQLQELVPLLKPDIVLYEFFMNEFEEISITPQSRRENIGLVSSFGDIERFFRNSQVIMHLAKYKNKITEQVKENPYNWRYWKSLLYFYEKGNNPLYTNANLNLLKGYLSSMQNLVESHSGKFIICFVPGAITVSAEKDINYFPHNINLSDTTLYDLNKPINSLKQVTNDLQINLLDLTHELKTNPGQPVYFPDSWHWNKEGHKVTASTISKYLFENKFISKNNSGGN